MKHIYTLTGLSCNGCKATVEKLLLVIPGVTHALVDLKKSEVTIDMENHIPITLLQSGLSDHSKYQLAEKRNNNNGSLNAQPAVNPTMVNNTNELEQYFCPMHCEGDKVYDKPGNCPVCGMHLVPKVPKDSKKDALKKPALNTNLKGAYYCPMHCEGNKTYDKPGDCPVCGMDLVKAPSAIATNQNTEGEVKKYTCPMHPQIIKDEPGSCPICGMGLVPLQPAEDEDDATYKALWNKFKIAILFTIPIFLIAMSDMLPGNPLYKLFDQHSWNWIQFALSLPVIFYATWMFFRRAWTSIITWNLNMFTLIGIGTTVAFMFSVVAMLFPNIFPAQFKTANGTVFVYFEASTVILTLILLGQLLEARAHSRTSGAIKALLKLVPSEALLLVNGEEKIIPIEAIKKGDQLRIKPGEKIPVDGKLIQGAASIDEAMITGEPVPVDKIEGDNLSSGTINTTSSFVMEAEKVGSETLLSRIIQLVNDASRSRAPIQKLADKISKYFVPIVVIISLLTFFAWVMFGPEPRYVYAFVNAIAVLIIACPCALGLATPMSVMVGVGKGAQSGVLIKNAEALEHMNKIDVLIIDKTGTITEGKPSVEKIVAENGFKEDELLQQISSLNKQSEHPLAAAVVKYGNEKKTSFSTVNDFKTIAGKGVTGTVEGKKIALGNKMLMEEIATDLPENIANQVQTEQAAGKTVSYISVDGKIAGFITITDKIKDNSKAAIKTLLDSGIEVIMLTGDNAGTAKAVADELNLSAYKAEYLPEDKLNEIKKLQAEGKRVAMAGDGINDAPALAQADVGIGMGTGTDVAIESSSITLVKGDLNGIVKAEKLSRAVMKNIKQNLFFAFIYNVIGVPIAAGILFPFFGILLSPMIAAAAMSISSVSVIANALRLKNIKL